MGVDPGLTRCGVGIVDGTPGARPQFVAVGVIRTDPHTEHAYRLLAIEEGLGEWFDHYQPQAISIERVFAQHNLSTVTGIGQVAGIAMMLGARHGIDVALHTPSEVKSAVTGSGRADKAQVGVMVAQVLHLAKAPTPADAADALALAVTHLWRGSAQNRYATAALQGRSSAAVARARRSAAIARAARSRTERQASSTRGTRGSS
ncbi:crossover junction endodeoxyribonuclease RuvC [Propionibacterium freudenreichii]|uniref:Crossover junction endodeoxyribonuclease RuvC n=7 Tax=Propionibacterium freudenreichii TaxID=1744 RepID=D7GDT3_PROFC|nr:crossover junction endodeoxyribonuclease RuvC [Propionibacterium freudenreichii]MDN5985242.1 crossover junction endodeoxyribonuclease RuvC [Propionibacterium sp.]AJQ90737.1 Crossover junction endodeoxyribonuclease RuvC [Propionibacterium freudenreichii subsp. freudenreichii]ARO12008.1 crossover junction endodeoxyribonuclease RuvC [Propionibacterium freudenreichii]AWY95755.1 Crossover junction endodeoxyribonuclease RuvC [Propionibacterium freudenreichii]MCQ1997473.1 crossover junction endode